MSLQSWREVLVTAQGDGTAITNSTTQASIIPAQAKFTLPANFIDTPGKTFRIFATGRMSNVVTTPGTVLFDVRFGANVVFNNGAGTIALNTTAKTNVTWSLDLNMTVRTVGASTTATLLGVGQFCSESVVGSAAGVANTAYLPASAPAVGAGFDSTVANVVDLQAKFSVATATTALTLHTYMLEALN
jgi:hypothetical protein